MHKPHTIAEFVPQSAMQFWNLIHRRAKTITKKQVMRLVKLQPDNHEREKNPHRVSDWQDGAGMDFAMESEIIILLTIDDDLDKSSLICYPLRCQFLWLLAYLEASSIQFFAVPSITMS